MFQCIVPLVYYTGICSPQAIPGPEGAPSSSMVLLTLLDLCSGSESLCPLGCCQSQSPMFWEGPLEPAAHGAGCPKHSRCAVLPRALWCGTFCDFSVDALLRESVPGWFPPVTLLQFYHLNCYLQMRSLK